MNNSKVGIVLYRAVILSALALPVLTTIHVTRFVCFYIDCKSVPDCNGYNDCGECDDCVAFTERADKLNISYYNSLDDYVGHDGRVDIAGIRRDSGTVTHTIKGEYIDYSRSTRSGNYVLDIDYAKHKGWFKDPYFIVQPDHYHCEGCDFRYCGMLDDDCDDCADCDGQ